MPIVPTFAGFAQKPDLAQAWLGGRKIALEEQSLRQQAAEAAQRASVAYAQIANQRVIAELEASAKAAAQAKENLLAQQQLEYDKVYKDALIGVQERNVAVAEKKAQFDITQKAEEARARDAVWQKINAGVDPAKAMASTPGFDVPSGVWSAMVQGKGPVTPGEVKEVDIGGQKAYAFGTGTSNYQLVQPRTDTGLPRQARSFRERYLTKQIESLDKELEALSGYEYLDDEDVKTKTQRTNKALALKKRGERERLARELDDMIKKMENAPVIREYDPTTGRLSPLPK